MANTRKKHYVEGILLSSWRPYLSYCSFHIIVWSHSIFKSVEHHLFAPLPILTLIMKFLYLQSFVCDSNSYSPL